MKVAVLGASGFIGTRIVEMMRLDGGDEVRPVVRSPAHLARLSKFSLDSRIADARDEPALTVAFAGCDVVVHAIAGSADMIVAGVAPVYRAAQRARVRRLIYLSSASVHGQAPLAGTTEESPLSDRQVLEYNNAKVRAERLLQSLRARGDVEVVILRPSIVFGPRSFWVGNFADALLSDQAYLVNNGKGICNSIYVDNLVHGIKLAASSASADRHAFFLSDEEEVTWHDLYKPIAEAVGFNLDQVQNVEPVFPTAPSSFLKRAKASSAARAAASMLPQRLRRALSAGFAAGQNQRRTHSPWAPPNLQTRASIEMSLLYTCTVRLSDCRARRILGYRPLITFSEACQRTVGWLEFAGYPLVSSPA
jgi:2-alkyl-3-oxoalkanoate reductase